MGRAVESEDQETRARDEHIKNLPDGQMEILMTDHSQGTLHIIIFRRVSQKARLGVYAKTV